MLPQNNTLRKTPRKQRLLPKRAANLKHRPVSAYMRVDNALLDEYWKQISLVEKAVLIAVMRLVERAENATAIISIAQIVSYAGIAPNSARIGLDDLTARGVLVMVEPATRKQGATYSVAYPKIAAAAPRPQRMTHDEIVAAITDTVSADCLPAARHERKQRLLPARAGNPAPAAPNAPATVRHRLALMNAPEYSPLYDAVHETVFAGNVEIPESRIGKVTRVLLELQPPCTPVELQDCAAWYSTAHNNPLPCDKDCPPQIAAALQDYRAARIASESGDAHDAA
jgi:hypothetical protein